MAKITGNQKTLVRALKQAGYTLFAERVKSFGKGAFSPLEGNPSFILGELSERLDEDFSYIVEHLAEKEKQNTRHSKTLSQAIDILNAGLSLDESWDGGFKLGYVPLVDYTPASEIYRLNTKNPDQSLVEELKKVDAKARENRTKLAVALKEAGMAELADALPVRLYTTCTTPSDILFVGFVWSQTEEGPAAWDKAFDTIRNIEKQNAIILKDLQKIDPTLKSLNYCKPDTSSKLALYKSKVSIPHADVLTKLEAAQKLKEHAVRDLYALKLREAADYVEKMEFDLPEYALTSDVIDSFAWRDHEAGYPFWVEVFKKVRDAEKVTRTNKEKLVEAVKDLGYHDKAEALKDIRFDLSSKAYSPARTLMCGFEWAASTQGSLYWGELHDELDTAEAKLAETPKEKLVAALHKVACSKHANLIEGMAGDFRGEEPAAILRAGFVWQKTEQGHMFWSEAECKLKGLGKDKEWHDECRARRAKLVSALLDIGCDDVAKTVAGLTHERFHSGKTAREIWSWVPMDESDDKGTVSSKLEIADKVKKKMNTNQKTLIETLKKLGELEASAHIEKMDGSIFGQVTPADMLEHDFRWVSTDQGHLYWSNILKRVRGLVKSAEWHDACKARQLLLVEACFNAGRRDAANLVKAFPYERFDEGETPVEVSYYIPSTATAQGPKFWEGLREDLEKVSNCTAELAAKKRLIDAVYEVTGKTFATLQELPLSEFSGDFYTAAEMLIRNFDWYESSEGSKFWEGVHDKLEARQTVTVSVFAGGGKAAGASGCTVKFVRVPEEGGAKPYKALINMHDTYKTRDGRDVRVLCVDVLDDTYKVIALVKNADGTSESMHEFTATGNFYADEQGDDDLVLHSTKDPRDSLKIDEAVLVRSPGQKSWQLQYYAGKTPEGAHSVWAFGKKSTDRTAMQTTWSRWKVNGVEVSA